MQEPARLVIWEAQYGDFINGAQVIIDEFLVSAARQVGPAAVAGAAAAARHEGQGPDHASARPERFLQLAADINMRVANCTTAAQYFHLLRRQAALLTTDPLPLIVLTPKSLLRHPLVASTPRELAEGRFQQVIDDEDAERPRGRGPPRDRLCSGKVYVDLVGSRAARGARPTSRSAGVEQLYPFPMRDLRAALDALSRRRRDRLGAGRAGEHGRVGLHPPAPAGGVERPSGAPRRRVRAAPARRKDRPRATRSTSRALIAQAFGGEPVARQAPVGTRG